jgi:hypothetical protein
MAREVDRIFVGQPLDLGGGGSNPPRPLGPSGPLGCFRLPMMNPCGPPLPLNMPYRRPFDYIKYVKDFHPNNHVKVFNSTIRANGKTKDEEIINLFSFTLRDIMFDWCNNYMGNYLDYTFA